MYSNSFDMINATTIGPNCHLRKVLSVIWTMVYSYLVNCQVNAGIRHNADDVRDITADKTLQTFTCIDFTRCINDASKFTGLSQSETRL